MTIFPYYIFLDFRLWLKEFNIFDLKNVFDANKLPLQAIQLKSCGFDVSSFFSIINRVAKTYAYGSFLGS